MKIYNPQDCTFIITQKLVVNDPQPAQDPAQPEAAVDPTADLHAVTLHRKADGTIDGVRIKTIDEDFILALHDLKDDEGNAKKYNWDDMMAAIKRGEFRTLTRRQWGYVSANIHKINDRLDEAGGEPITKGCYWSCESLEDVPYPDGECYGYRAWCFYGTLGALNLSNKFSSYQVRPALAFD